MVAAANDRLPNTKASDLSFGALKHLHHVEIYFYCPQTFLSFKFQCRDDVSEFKWTLWSCNKQHITCSSVKLLLQSLHMVLDSHPLFHSQAQSHPGLLRGSCCICHAGSQAGRLCMRVVR